MPLRNVRPKSFTVTIPDTGTTSNSFPVQDGSYRFEGGAIVVPDLTSTNTFKYQVSVDGTNFVDLKTTAGAAFTATIPENQTIPLPPELFSFVAARVVASGAQTGAKTFTVYMY